MSTIKDRRICLVLAMLFILELEDVGTATWQGLTGNTNLGIDTGIDQLRSNA